MAKLPPGCRASSSMPIIKAMPTGSFAPDSPSRIVPERPRTALPLSTENITAGSVGASAAPTMPATIQGSPSSQCASTATSAAVAKVPSTPSERTGMALRRIRFQPMCMPPSNRITTSATVAMRPTVCSEIALPSRGQRSDAPAATARKIAGAGTRSSCVSFVEASASRNPPATTSMIAP